MNRILLKAGFIALLALFGTLPSLADTFEWGGLWYETLDDEPGACKVVRSQGSSYSGDINIPATVSNNGTTYNVVAIGESAFENCSDMTSVTIPEGITRIENNAFAYDRKIGNVALPESLKTIGGQSFYGCSSITSIVIPDNVTTIDFLAFGSCSLESIVIGSSVTMIGSGAFAIYAHSDDKLTKITVRSMNPPECLFDPFSVSTLDNAVLEVPAGTENAYSAEYPWSRFIIGDPADYILTDGILRYRVTDMNKKECKVIRSNESPEGDIVIPDAVNGYKVVSISDEVFRFASITSVVMGANITEIGRYAFEGCDNLATVTLNEGLQTIGSDCFRMCTKLTEITIPASVKEIGHHAFRENPALLKVYALADVPCDFVFPDDGLGTSSIATLYVPAGAIDAYQAAQGWNQFAHITDDWNSNYLFEKDGIHYNILTDNTCIVLAVSEKDSGNIVIPETVTYNNNEYTVTAIYDRAFSSCDNLTLLDIPATVTSLGWYAVAGSRLSTLICRAVQPPSAQTNISLASDGVIYVPEESITAYTDDQYWGSKYPIKGLSEIPMYATVDGIVYRLFPKEGTATVLADPSYSSMSSADIKERVDGPDGKSYTVTVIDAKAFYHCTELLSVNLPSTISTISEYAFSSTGLTSINLPAELETIGKGAFSSLTELTSLVVPDKVSTIGEMAFEYCWSISNLVIGESVRNIGNLAFFSALTKSTAITVKAIEPPVCGTTTFSDNLLNSGMYLSVPAESEEKYESTEPWSRFRIGDASTWEFESDSIRYLILDKKALTCEVMPLGNDRKYQGDITIPASVEHNGNTYKVEAIGKAAFQNCRDLTSIVLMDGIKRIEDDAFMGSNLSEVTLPASLERIGRDSFHACDFKSIVIPDNVTTIERSAFGFCFSLEAIEMGANVATIGDVAFQYCNGLKTIITHAVKAPQCGNNVFADVLCESIYLQIVPEGATGYDVDPWSRFSREEVEFMADGILYRIINQEAGICKVMPIADDQKYQGDINIPATVTNNGKTYTVEAIGEQAFWNCRALTSVSIAEGISRIENDAFSGSNIGNLKLPESLESIGNSSFFNCNSITSLVIPDKVTTIGYSAFGDCLDLESVVIGASVTTIGDRAFADCREISKITVNASVAPECGSNVFVNVYCKDVYLKIVPENATGYDAEPWSLFSTVAPKEPEFVVGGIRYRILDPNASTCEVMPLADGQNYQGDITIPASVENNGKTYKVEAIGERAFYMCDELNSVTIADGITRIEDAAFSNSNFSNSTLPSSIESIGSNSFYNCYYLTSIVIPDNVKTIGSYAFGNCRNLESMVIGSSVETIERGAFEDCRNLTKITVKAAEAPGCGTDVFAGVPCEDVYLQIVPENATGYDAEPWSLFKVAAPEVLEFVYDDIRYRIVDQEAMTCKVMPRSDESGEAARAGAVKAMSLLSRADDGLVYDKPKIVIPAKAVKDESIEYTVIEIAEGAFRNCTEVTSVTLPATVTTIGSNAFENSGITEMTIPESVTEIKPETFKGCSELASVTIPASVESIGNAAFLGCDALMRITMEGSVPPTCGDGGNFSEVFSDETIKNATLVVPEGSEDKYNDANVWEDFGNKTQTTTVGGISFEVSDKDAKTVTVTGFVAGSYDGAAIPSTVVIDGATYTVNAIAAGAFKGCEALTKLVIPTSVETIGDGAFAGCTNLISVTALSDTPAEIAGQAFDDAAYSTVMLAVPEGTAESYRQANDWSRFVNIVDGTSGIDSIEADDTEAVIYDLTGRRVKHPTAGFYIVNGRKVFIRR